MHRANSRGARDGFGSCFMIREIWGWRFSHGQYAGRVKIRRMREWNLEDEVKRRLHVVSYARVVLD